VGGDLRRVVALPGLVARVAMPTLGVLLIVASAGAIKPKEVVSIWSTGWPSRVTIAITFLATLILPIQVAVGLGVALSAVLYLYQSAADVSVVELVERPDGRIEERKPAKRLRSHDVTVLDVYGHLFYAGARTLGRLLPKPADAQNPVVILRLRGRITVGATLIDELTGYADQLAEANGRLYLTGLSEEVDEQMASTGKLREADPVRAYSATPIVGESTRAAVDDARMWLLRTSDATESDVATQDDESGNATPGDGERPA
jgi:sulfate permease, SulP family